MTLGHAKLSAWYHVLAQQLEAGLPFPDAVRSSRGVGMPATALEAMAQRIELGGSVEDAWRAVEERLPVADRTVLAAAAEAGRMPRTLHSLSARHAEVAKVQRRLLLACLYPLAVLHLGILISPLAGMLDWEKGFVGSTLSYARGVASTLVPLWLVIGFIWVQTRRGNALVLAIGRRLPFIGGYAKHQGLSDFAFALGNFLDAGVRIERAWSLAGAASPLPDLRAAAKAMEGVIARGDRPGQHLAASPCFPPEFVAFYQTGETAGQLEQNLLHVSRLAQDRASRSLTVAALAYPALAFMIVAGLVAIKVLGFFLGYYKSIEKLGG